MALGRPALFLGRGSALVDPAVRPADLLRWLDGATAAGDRAKRAAGGKPLAVCRSGLGEVRRRSRRSRRSGRPTLPSAWKPVSRAQGIPVTERASRRRKRIRRYRYLPCSGSPHCHLSPDFRRGWNRNNGPRPLTYASAFSQPADPEPGSSRRKRSLPNQAPGFDPPLTARRPRKTSRHQNLPATPSPAPPAAMPPVSSRLPATLPRSRPV